MTYAMVADMSPHDARGVVTTPDMFPTRPGGESFQADATFKPVPFPDPEDEIRTALLDGESLAV